GKSCVRTSARLKPIPLRFGVTGEISAEICGTVDATCEICVWIVETRADIRSVLRVSRSRRHERDWSSKPEGLKSGQSVWSRLVGRAMRHARPFFWSAPAERSDDGALNRAQTGVLKKTSQLVGLIAKSKAPSSLRSAGALHMQ